jgi:hypothetical protein
MHILNILLSICSIPREIEVGDTTKLFETAVVIAEAQSDPERRAEFAESIDRPSANPSAIPGIAKLRKEAQAVRTG